MSMSDRVCIKSEVLNSWKEISEHLDRGIRTVQPWERDLGVSQGTRCPTVLVVDDEPNVRELRRALLERFGFHAIVAASGPQALEIFVRTAVDAVILDYLMPGMDGRRTASEIRKLNQVIPIILSSASITDATMEDFFTASVPKGSDPRCLLATLKDQLQRVCRHRQEDQR